MPDDSGEVWLCLRHAGQLWDERRRLNRLRHRCRCGAPRDARYATCTTCREKARVSKYWRRLANRRAAECGISLAGVRNGRARAFMSAFDSAASRARAKAEAAWLARLAAALRSPAAGLAPVGEWAEAEWEGRRVVVGAVMDRGGRKVGGLRVRG